MTRWAQASLQYKPKQSMGLQDRARRDPVDIRQQQNHKRTSMQDPRPSSKPAEEDVISMASGSLEALLRQADFSGQQQASNTCSELGSSQKDFSPLMLALDLT